MKKYRVSATNVPIFIEIRSGDKIRSIFFERSYGLQTVKLPIWRKKRIGFGWQSQFISHKTKLYYNNCIKIQIKQEISLKKIFGGSQILTILTQLSDEIPLYSLSLHAEKTSESFQILGTSPAKAREQCY